MGAAAGAVFSLSGVSAAGAVCRVGAGIACAIALDEFGSVCRDVFWTRSLSARKYQHWRPLFAWSMREYQRWPCGVGPFGFSKQSSAALRVDEPVIKTSAKKLDARTVLVPRMRPPPHFVQRNANGIQNERGLLEFAIGAAMRCKFGDALSTSVNRLSVVA